MKIQPTIIPGPLSCHFSSFCYPQKVFDLGSVESLDEGFFGGKFQIRNFILDYKIEVLHLCSAGVDANEWDKQDAGWPTSRV